ncbi:MAG: DUF2520 domain-containing protein [Candidatus Aminicenantes bacterium]|jgi:predicted short-subunit dehydrogenase-like oxidoreductase (DUF2520 family)
MRDVAIIGAGRLGTSLAYALSKNGYRIAAFSCRSKESAEESRTKIGQGTASSDNIWTAGQGEIVILTVPDDGIEGIVEELAHSDSSWEEKAVFHCSGLLTSSVLDALRSQGARTASVHPCMSFPKKQRSQDLFRGIYFALEGEDLAVSTAKDLIDAIGGRSFMIRPENKACYHTACSMASNMSVALLYTAVTLLGQCGLGEDRAQKILWPLLEGTLHNVNKINIFKALSGPVTRGDLTTIQKHLAELEKYPSARRIYIDLAKQALEMTKREKKTSEEKISSLEALLGRE